MLSTNPKPASESLPTSEIVRVGFNLTVACPPPYITAYFRGRKLADETISRPVPIPSNILQLISDISIVGMFRGILQDSCGHACSQMSSRNPPRTLPNPSRISFQTSQMLTKRPRSLKVASQKGKKQSKAGETTEGRKGCNRRGVLVISGL